ncbi:MULTISPECIES: hypothetical protein [unclassified Paenibacillus]|nr:MULTISPECIES: hypothetical protein [unclassified Paenibacillus]MBD8841164.1 hypothetical protein [Paenibacillus sp. CFBP 13594]
MDCVQSNSSTVAVNYNMHCDMITNASKTQTIQYSFKPHGQANIFP